MHVLIVSLFCPSVSVLLCSIFSRGVFFFAPILSFLSPVSPGFPLLTVRVPERDTKVAGVVGILGHAWGRGCLQ